MHVFLLLKVAAAASMVLAASRLYRALLDRRARSALQRRKGTQPVPRHLRGVFLWRFLRGTLAEIRAFRAHRLMEANSDMLFSHGRTTLIIHTIGAETVFTIDPANIKTVLALDHEKWHHTDTRKASLTPLLGPGIFTTDGAPWQHSRQMLRPSFARAQVADLDLLEPHVSRLISMIPRDGATVDLSDLFHCLTMDTVTELLFGKSTLSLSGTNLHQTFTTAFDRASYDCMARVVLPLVDWLPGVRGRIARDIKTVQAFADRHVQEALARREKLAAEPSRPTDRYVFLDELARQLDDPVSIRHARVWQALQSEVATLDGQRPSFEQLKDLSYTRAVVNETLRLYPPVSLNSRKATEDTTLPTGGGPDGSAPIFMKKGDVLTWQVWTMHRRTDLFGDDAAMFRPERWLDDPATGAKGIRPTWEFLPFNGGPRICLGQQLALTSAAYATVRLCQTFARIESRDGHEWEEELGLVGMNHHGTKVGLFVQEGEGKHDDPPDARASMPGEQSATSTVPHDVAREMPE